MTAARPRLAAAGSVSARVAASGPKADGAKNAPRAMRASCLPPGSRATFLFADGGLGAARKRHRARRGRAHRAARATPDPLREPRSDQRHDRPAAAAGLDETLQLHCRAHDRARRRILRGVGARNCRSAFGVCRACPEWSPCLRGAAGSRDRDRVGAPARCAASARGFHHAARRARILATRLDVRGGSARRGRGRDGRGRASAKAAPRTCAPEHASRAPRASAAREPNQPVEARKADERSHVWSG